MATYKNNCKQNITLVVEYTLALPNSLICSPHLSFIAKLNHTADQVSIFKNDLLPDTLMFSQP